MNTLKFGAEIEFFGVDYRTVIEKLQDKGINVSFEGYTHRVMNSWKLVTDSSIHSRNLNTGLSYGLELVSPILLEDAGLDELEKVLDTLSEIGAKVNKTCGIHIHHDVSNYTIENFKSIYALMFNLSNGIDMMMPESRRDGGFCKSLEESTIRKIQNMDTLAEMRGSYLGGRYKTLNFESYTKYGTLEFRQHSGSVESEKVINWVIFIHHLISYAKNNQVQEIEKLTVGKALSFIRNKMGLQGTELSKYIGKRIKKLNRGSEIAA